MTRTRALFAVVSVLALSACASRMMVNQEPIAKPDEALIVFLRTDEAPGFTSLTLYDITDPEIKFIGMIPPLAKVAYSVKPGRYAFMVLATSTDFMEATVAAGKHYFALVSPDESTAKPRYKFTAVRQADIATAKFIRLESAAPYVAKTPRADEWYSRNTAPVTARREKYFMEWFRKPAQERDAQTLRAEDGQ